jgi:aryl-alcohol dehydrogenase-like predicted oxidoreductase
MMLHRAAWLEYWNDGLGNVLREKKKQGLIRYLGVSVYSVQDALKSIDHPDIDIIQIPCNAWDQRMRIENVFNQALKNGKLCFVRSIYLQGLLSMDVDAVKQKLPHALEASKRWHELSLDFGSSPMQLAARFAASLPAPCVIGAESIEQVNDNNELFSAPPLSSEEIERIYIAMAPLINEDIYNPAKWRRI